MLLLLKKCKGEGYKGHAPESGHAPVRALLSLQEGGGQAPPPPSQQARTARSHEWYLDTLLRCKLLALWAAPAARAPAYS